MKRKIIWFAIILAPLITNPLLSATEDDLLFKSVFSSSSVLELPALAPEIEVTTLDTWFDATSSSIGFAHNYSKAKLTIEAEIASGDESKWNNFDLRVGLSNTPTGCFLDNGNTISILSNGVVQGSGAWVMASNISRDDYRGGAGNQSPVTLTYGAKANSGALAGNRSIKITYTISEDG